MIQIRTTDGATIPIPKDGRFLELVNDMDGTVMMVFVQIAPGTILQVKPGTMDAEWYQKTFESKGVKFSESMIVRESR